MSNLAIARNKATHIWVSRAENTVANREATVVQLVLSHRPRSAYGVFLLNRIAALRADFTEPTRDYVIALLSELLKEIQGDAVTRVTEAQ